MKTKFILLFLGMLCYSFSSFAQDSGFSCDFKAPKWESKRATKPTKPVSTNPCGDDEITYMRVNVHFIQKNHSSTLDAGNFTATDDGLGNTCWTGYDHARKLVKRMNDYWKRNVQVALWPGSDQNPQSTPPDILPTKIQMDHTGTYFHPVSDQVYHTLSNGGSFTDIIDTYGINLGQDINIFMMERETSCATGGEAFPIAGKYSFYLYNGWKIYANDPTDGCVDCIDCNAQSCGTCGDGTTAMAKVSNHEMGHLLGLGHSFCGGNGCGDIDTAQETEGPGPYPGCAPAGCDPCWTSGSNNVMAYVNTNVAFSPCQVGIALSELDDLADYISDCCDNWTFIPTNAVEGKPAKRMVIECDLPLCSNFAINQTTYEYVNGFNCVFGYTLSGANASSNCNEWTITTFNNWGQIINVQTFSNQNSVLLGAIPNQYKHEVHVTVCGTDCEPYSRCFRSTCAFAFSGDDGGESIDDPTANPIQFDLNSSDNGLTVFPNPTSSSFKIKLEESVESGTLYIFNTDGKLLSQYEINDIVNKNISVTNFPKGVYLIQLESGGKNIYEKLIVQ